MKYVYTAKYNGWSGATLVKEIRVVASSMEKGVAASRKAMKKAGNHSPEFLSIERGDEIALVE